MIISYHKQIVSLKKHSIQVPIGLVGIMWKLIEIVLWAEEMLWVWRRWQHWGCHGGGRALRCPNIENWHTHSWKPKNLSPSNRHIWTISRCSAVFHSRIGSTSWWMISTRMRGGCGGGRGRLGPLTSGRLDRSRLKGARPCLGLPYSHYHNFLQHLASCHTYYGSHFNFVYLMLSSKRILYVVERDTFLTSGSSQ